MEEKNTSLLFRTPSMHLYCEIQIVYQIMLSLPKEVKNGIAKYSHMHCFVFYKVFSIVLCYPVLDGIIKLALLCT